MIDESYLNTFAWMLGVGFTIFVGFNIGSLLYALNTPRKLRKDLIKSKRTLSSLQSKITGYEGKLAASELQIIDHEKRMTELNASMSQSEYTSQLRFRSLESSHIQVRALTEATAGHYDVSLSLYNSLLQEAYNENDKQKVSNVIDAINDAMSKALKDENLYIIDFGAISRCTNLRQYIEELNNIVALCNEHSLIFSITYSDIIQKARMLNEKVSESVERQSKALQNLYRMADEMMQRRKDDHKRDIQDVPEIPQ